MIGMPSAAGRRRKRVGGSDQFSRVTQRLIGCEQGRPCLSVKTLREQGSGQIELRCCDAHFAGCQGEQGALANVWAPLIYNSHVASSKGRDINAPRRWNIELFVSN
jgi:hypothetical protein